MKACCRSRPFAMQADGLSISRSFTSIRALRGLLRQPSTELLWRRLGTDRSLLSAPEVIQRLLDIVDSGNRGQLEVDRDDRCLRLSAIATDDLISLMISDVTDLKRREESFRLLFDNNPMPMWVFDIETMQFLGVNDAAIQALRL